jgi:hypothetical protein
LRQQAAPAYFGVGGDCGGFTQRNNQPYCSDTVSGSCLTCKDGKGASAPDSACVGLPCGTDVRLTQAAGSKCSGDVAQGTVACADSGQVEGNCKKCMYDAVRGYATYENVPASECFSQSLVCGIKPTVAPTARPTVRPTVGPTLKPNCYIVAGKEVCYGTTPVPTAVLTKTPTTVPTNPFAGVTAGVGGVSPTSPVTTSVFCPVDGGSNGCQGDTLVQCVGKFPKVVVVKTRCPYGCSDGGWGASGCKQGPTKAPTTAATRAPIATPKPTAVSTKCGSLDRCEFGKVCVDGKTCVWSSQVTPTKGLPKTPTAATTRTPSVTGVKPTLGGGVGAGFTTPTPKPDRCLAFGLGCPAGYSCSGLFGTCQADKPSTGTVGGSPTSSPFAGVTAGAGGATKPPAPKPGCSIIAGKEVCYGATPAPTKSAANSSCARLGNGCGAGFKCEFDHIYSFNGNCEQVVTPTNKPFPKVTGNAGGVTKAPTMTPAVGVWSACNSQIKCPAPLTCTFGRCLDTSLVPTQSKITPAPFVNLRCNTSGTCTGNAVCQGSNNTMYQCVGGKPVLAAGGASFTFEGNCNKQEVEVYMTALTKAKELVDLEDTIQIRCGNSVKILEKGVICGSVNIAQTYVLQQNQLNLLCDPATGLPKSWGDENYRIDAAAQTAIHEAAHLWAMRTTNSASIESFNVAIGCKKKGLFDYTFTEKPVSEYGETNCPEAFAESAAAYYSDPCQMKNNYPAQYKWFVENPDSPGAGSECKE